MNTKQLVSAGTLYAGGDKWHLVNPKPLSKLDWMTPSQQRWLVVPYLPTALQDPHSHKYIYLPERVIMCDCSQTVIVYPVYTPEPVIMLVQETQFEGHDNSRSLSDAELGYHQMLIEIGTVPGDDAMMQGDVE